MWGIFNKCKLNIIFYSKLKEFYNHWLVNSYEKVWNYFEDRVNQLAFSYILAKKTIMKKLLFGALALILFAGVGCKKDKDATCDLSSAALVGNYKVTAATSQTGTDPAVDVFEANFDACERDDVYNFSENNTFTLSDVGVLCDPTSNETGTWALNGNVLTVNSDGDISNLTLESFGCNSFVISQAALGTTLRITFTRL